MDIPKTREAAKGTPFEAAWDTPNDWPRNIRHLSVDDALGVDPLRNEIYFGGHKLVSEKRFSDFERWLAVLALGLTVIGVAATCVQAWFAAFPPPPLP